MRVFISFPVAAEIRQKLVEVQADLRARCTKYPLGWIPPPNFHVTVEFLGEIDEAQLKKVSLMIKQKIKIPNFFYRLTKIGALPDWHAGRYLLARVASENGEDVKFQKLIHHELAQHGFLLRNKYWIPHITLGRALGKENIDFAELEPMKLPTSSWQIKTIDLVKSEMTESGPVYTSIETI